MKPSIVRSLWVAHVVLLILAATNLSAISWAWSSRAWSCEFFQYAYKNGWGYVYVSDYSLPCVLAYIAAFAIGLIACIAAGRVMASGWIVVAILLNLAGLVSFLIESSHWVIDHHLSLIGICPAANFLISVGLLIRLARDSRVSPPFSNAVAVQQ